MLSDYQAKCYQTQERVPFIDMSLKGTRHHVRRNMVSRHLGHVPFRSSDANGPLGRASR